MNKFQYAQIMEIEGNDYTVRLKIEDIEKIDIKKIGLNGYKITIFSKIGVFILDIKDYELAKILETINALGIKDGWSFKNE